MNKKLLSGNEAIARGAYEAGVKVACSYPGTPATEINEALVGHKEIYTEWSANEKVALEIAFGACYAGKRAIVSMKHVGLNVAADPLFTISYAGVNSGLVIVSADDPGIFSSQNEQDNRNYAKFAKIPMLEPSDSQEAKDFTKLAFDISEKYDTPVLLRLTTRVSHSKSIVELGQRKESQKEIKKDIKKYVMIPSHAKPRHVFVEERLKKLEDLSNKINKIEYNNYDIGIITNGISYQYAKEVMPNASFLKLNMSYPLPKKLITEFSKKVKKLYVIEELDPFIEEQVKALGVNCIGKEKFPICGELSPSMIDSILNNKTYSKIEDVLPKRLPAWCNGCPYNSLFAALKELDLNVIGDIGCYTLAALEPYNALDVQINMGLSIGASFGVEKVSKEKNIAVIGDSTFVHSGITALIDIFNNKSTGTVIIIDNGGTAMTGMQPYPKVDFAKLAKAIGIKNIVKINSKSSIKSVIENEVNKKELSVIVYEEPCLLGK
nr:hypothetical protein [uncultured archaeon]